jgi:7-alpha-hydroxysteroid dehydrogenase
MSIHDLFRVDGQVALLVGAGKGMGAASALALAEAGADVTIASRTQADLDATAAKIKAETGRRVLTVVVDGNSDEQTKAAVDQTMAEYGRLDIVMTTLGGTPPGPFLETTDESWADALQGNLINGLRLARYAIPEMLKTGGGNIVFVSSGLGHIVGRGWSQYGTGKAALEHAIHLLAVELNPRIRVNAIAPGATITDGLNESMGDLYDALINNTPLARMGTVEDMAAGVLYLASPAGSYLTGQILGIDGGLVMSNFPMPYPDL